MRRRWAEYFEQVLNVDDRIDVREENINVSGNWWIPVSDEWNERAMSIEEVREAMNKMLSGKGWISSGVH